MTINYEKLINWSFEETRQKITAKDLILYSLGVGLGENPTDRNELRFGMVWWRTCMQHFDGFRERV